VVSGRKRIRRPGHGRGVGSLRHLLSGLCLLVLLNAVSSAFAQEPPRHHFKEVAQDGQGVVWAIENQLHVFNGREWIAMTAPFAEDDETKPLSLARMFAEGDKARPLGLARMRDGSMMCVWQLSNSRLAVTRHTCAESKLLGECPGKIENSGLKLPPFADSHNRLWITGAKPEIYHTDSGGHLALAHSIKPEQLIDVNDLKAHYGNVAVSEDGRGRAWVWTDSWAGGMNGAALRGVLIFDGDKAVQKEQFAGINNPRFSFIERKDDRHMWVAVVKEGLFAVDINTLEAAAMPEPEPGAFQWIKKVFSTGDDLFVIASRTENIFRSALWRLHDGKWTRLIENVDNGFSSSFDFSRAWLRIGKDIVLCSYHAAPWLIHEDATVERLDWQRGFSVENAWNIFLLNEGSLLGVGTRGQSFCGKVSLAPGNNKPPRTTELAISHHGFATDADGNVWAILFGSDHALSEWNGSRWIEHEIPADVKKQWIGEMIADTCGRIWLLPDSNELGAAYYDSHRKKWETFPKIEAAFESTITNPPQFVGERPKFYAADSDSTHRHLAFRNNKWQAAYFNGTSWQYFNRKDITGANDRDTALGAPFFNSDGALCVKIKEDTWMFDGKTAWQKTKPEDRFPDEWTGSPRSVKKLAPPEGCVTNAPESLAADNQGTFWLTWRGKLYKSAYGRCVEVFSGNEINPFTDGREIFGAWVDRHGNAFLQTAFDKRVMIAPKSPPPAASVVAVKKSSPDSVEVQLHADSASRVRFRWRLDGEPWQLGNDKTLAVDSLSNGPHTLTVLAIDDELQAGPETVAKFQITISPEAQMAALIKRLADPDFAKRASAVTALARQPAVALPALKTAREKAGDDQRWWIDAAIQEIKRKK